jgi:hypothetical protein
VADLHEWCKDVVGCDFNHCSLCESVYKLATEAAEALFVRHACVESIIVKQQAMDDGRGA